MKKIMLFTTAIALLSTAFTACKKDNPVAQVVYPSQSGGVTDFIAGKTLNTISTTYELGVSFRSSKSGTIKSLKVMVPNTGNKRVTLWKVSDHSIVASRTINCTSISNWNTLATEITIEADTDYMLSVNTDKYYRFSAAAGSLPFVKGNITLNNYRSNFGSSQTFPEENNGSLVYGFVDFTFQRAL